MKKIVALMLTMVFGFGMIAFTGCEAKVEEIKKKAEEGVENTVDKAKEGDLEGAKDAAAEGAEDVKKAVTGEGEKAEGEGEKAEGEGEGEKAAE